MHERFRGATRAINDFASSPPASGAALAIVVAWLVLGPRMNYSSTWQLLMTTGSAVVTFLMVFVIASAQKRDTQALQLKIDLLVAAHPDLPKKAVGLEAASEQIHREVRQELERTVGESEGA